MGRVASSRTHWKKYTRPEILTRQQGPQLDRGLVDSLDVARALVPVQRGARDAQGVALIFAEREVAVETRLLLPSCVNVACPAQEVLTELLDDSFAARCRLVVDEFADGPLR
jgi:hypothetical protein